MQVAQAGTHCLTVGAGTNHRLCLRPPWIRHCPGPYTALHCHDPVHTAQEYYVNLQ